MLLSSKICLSFVKSLWHESQREFKRLEDEFRRVINYKLERYAMQPVGIKNSFTQNINFVLQQKAKELEYHLKKMQMSNPRLQCKKGWAKVSVDGNSIDLKSLKKDKIFVLEDEETKVEAICLSSIRV